MRQHEQDDASRHRRSVRLSGYDYATTGAYFVTICTWRRQCLFGNVCEGEVRLNELGLIGRDEWSRTGLLRHNVETETCVVMPNHLHGIIAITSHRRGVLHTPQSSAVARTHLDLASGTPTNAPQESLRSPSETIGAIVRGFKSACSRRINQVRVTPNQPVWQRNYHEHVIRNEKDLQRLRQYILDNPSRWIDDRNHPSRIPTSDTGPH